MTASTLHSGTLFHADAHRHADAHGHAGAHRHADADGHADAHRHADAHGRVHPGGGRPGGGRPDEGRRLVLAIVFTAVILVAELAGGMLSGSLALISDAGHMFVDSISLVLSLIALRLSERPGTTRFTYGFRRVEILVALINGVTLLVVCAVIAYEGVQRFLHPVPIDLPLMLGVAVVGISANVVSAVLLRHAHSLNVRSAFLHVLGDLFSSVGIVVAALCMFVWNVPWLDPALSIVIAVVVLASAYRLTREAVGVLMEAAPEGVDTEAIRARLEDFPWVGEVHDLHVWTITSGLPALSCHVVLQPPAPDGADAVLTILSTALREHFGITHATIQIESTAFRAGYNPCDSC